MKALAPLDDIFALGGQRGGDGLVSEAVSLVVLQCRYAGLECLLVRRCLKARQMKGCLG